MPRRLPATSEARDVLAFEYSPAPGVMYGSSGPRAPTARRQMEFGRGC